MNSKQIESFLCVADCLNISVSAQKLYSSPSAVSRQIASLEEELGMALFIRGNNHLHLTPAGERIYKLFIDLSFQFHVQYEEALSLSKGAQGMLRLGFYAFMRMDFFFDEVIYAFQKKYPHIHLKYECIPVGDLENCASSNKYDLVFVHSFDKIESPNLIYHKVCDTKQFLLYGVRNSKADKENLSFVDFKDDPFWVVEGRSENRGYIQKNKRIFDYYGISDWRTMSAPNFDTVLFNIQMGNGCCFLDPCTAALNNKNYRKLKLADEISSVSILMARDRNNTNPAIPLFIDVFNESFKMPE